MSNLKLYNILFESIVNISEEITDAQREQMKRLKPDDRITVFHGTPLFRLPHLINGFDSTQEHKRDYRGGAHRGLFVTLDWEMAKRFGGGAILELEVKAKNIHGTDYGGNIGREQEMSDKTEEFIKGEHPESFRPYLNYTMLQKGEPQGLLIGVVGPNQIKRVWVREGNDWKEYTREEYLKKESVYNVEFGKEKRFKEADIDLSSPKIKLDEFLKAYAVANNRAGEEDSLKQYLLRYARRDLDDLRIRLGDMSIGGSNLGKLALENIIRQLKNEADKP